MSETIAGAEVEMELAFLPIGLPKEIESTSPQRVTDIYLSDDKDLLTKLRLRQKGSKFELTKKVVVNPADLSVQQEYNIPLTQDEFEKFSKIEGREVIKDRYVMDIAGRQAEIDIFRGHLAGFGIVEFEFSSVEDKAAFVAPDFCGAEVTQEDFIAGAYLAGKSYEDIAPELERFGYEPIFYED